MGRFAKVNKTASLTPLPSPPLWSVSIPPRSLLLLLPLFLLLLLILVLRLQLLQNAAGGGGEKSLTGNLWVTRRR